MTVQDVIDLAVETSNLNDPDLISETELIRFISIFQQKAYMAAAQMNPDYFGKEGNTAARASHTASWDLSSTPGDVAAVSKIEIQTITGTVSGLSVGDEVSMVSIRSPEDGLAPRVYIRGQRVHEYGGELSTDASNYVTRLKLYYSEKPATLTATTDTISLPDEHLPLLYLPLGRTMAIRDQRPEEAARLDDQFAFFWSGFMKHVSTYDEGTIREIGQVPAASRSPMNAQ